MRLSERSSSTLCIVVALALTHLAACGGRETDLARVIRSSGGDICHGSPAAHAEADDSAVMGLLRRERAKHAFSWLMKKRYGGNEISPSVMEDFVRRNDLRCAPKQDGTATCQANPCSAITASKNSLEVFSGNRPVPVELDVSRTTGGDYRVTDFRVIEQTYRAGRRCPPLGQG